MSKIVILHGTPGSGKTTHARRLKELWPAELEHISIGDHLRSIRNGKVVSKYKEDIDAQTELLAQSAPLNHEIVNGVVFEFIAQCPTVGYVLLDGFPRFIEQLPLFYDSMTSEHHDYLGIIHLRISQTTCVSRLMHRGTRSGEKAVDKDFATWRFNEYQNNFLPAIALLGMNTTAVNIDAEPPIDVVWKTFYSRMYDFVFNS